MKKLMTILAILGFLFTVGQAIAADVVVITTIRDVHVANLTAMVQDKYMYQGSSDCTGLTVKQCFEKMCIKEAIWKEYRQWKYAQDMKSATDSVVSQNIEVEVE